MKHMSEVVGPLFRKVEALYQERQRLEAASPFGDLDKRKNGVNLNGKHREGTEIEHA